MYLLQSRRYVSMQSTPKMAPMVISSALRRDSPTVTTIAAERRGIKDAVDFLMSKKI